MSKMRAVQVTRANGPWEIVGREIPEPAQGSVRIKIEACGICHSDSVTKEGIWRGIRYPRVPGHEIAGVIDAVGAGVAGWKEGDIAKNRRLKDDNKEGVGAQEMIGELCEDNSS